MNNFAYWERGFHHLQGTDFENCYTLETLILVMKKLLFLIVFLGFIQVSYACTCYNFYKIPMFEGFNALTEIFEGTVLKKEVNNKTKLAYYYFKVEKAYKGVIKNEIVIITSASSAAACGQHFDPNSPWLVYAKDGFTTRCSLNARVSIQKNLNTIRAIQNLNILKDSQEKIVIETNKKGDTIAMGKLNINKQPIGCWKYVRRKNEEIITEITYYDNNGCLVKHPPYKTCN